jgi:hypothetical protein
MTVRRVARRASFSGWFLLYFLYYYYMWLRCCAIFAA